MGDLTQEQIDAMLRGEDIHADEAVSGTAQNSVDAIQAAAQEEAAAVPEEAAPQTENNDPQQAVATSQEPMEEITEDINEFLSPDEVDTIGEIGNICMVALDDFTFQDGYEPLLRLADIVKVDFLQYPNRDDLERLLRKIRRVGDKVLLAEKVETIEDFDMARELGFTLFQGFFFSRPKLHSGRHLSPMELSRLQLLRCLREDEMDFQQVAEIIKRDVVLSHKLLRIVNSSHYGLSFFVSSILHALTILGTEGTRKWISFAVLQDSAGDSEQELSRMALTRGLFMEKLTIPLHRRREKETFFLFGLFSMLFVLVDGWQLTIGTLVHSFGL